MRSLAHKPSYGRWHGKLENCKPDAHDGPHRPATATKPSDQAIRKVTILTEIWRLAVSTSCQTRQAPQSGKTTLDEPGDREPQERYGRQKLPNPPNWLKKLAPTPHTLGGEDPQRAPPKDALRCWQHMMFTNSGCGASFCKLFPWFAGPSAGRG